MRGWKERSQGRNEMGGIALISSQVSKAVVVLFTGTQRAGAIGVLEGSIEDDMYPLLGERYQLWGVQVLPRATHVSEEWHGTTRTRIGFQAKGGAGERAGLRRVSRPMHSRVMHLFGERVNVKGSIFSMLLLST